MISGLLRKMTSGRGIPGILDSDQVVLEKMFQGDSTRLIRDSMILAMLQSPKIMEVVSQGKTQIYGVSNTRQSVLTFNGNMMFGSNLEGESMRDYKTFIRKTLEKQDTLGIVPIQENQYNFLSEELNFGDPDLVGFQVPESPVKFIPILYLGRKLNN